MKKILFVVFLALILTGCSKQKEPAKDMDEKVVEEDKQEEKKEESKKEEENTEDEQKQEDKIQYDEVEDGPLYETVNKYVDKFDIKLIEGKQPSISIYLEAGDVEENSAKFIDVCGLILVEAIMEEDSYQGVSFNLFVDEKMTAMISGLPTVLTLLVMDDDYKEVLNARYEESPLSKNGVMEEFESNLEEIKQRYNLED